MARHLGGAGDHVLDVVGVTGHVDVRVVPIGCLVLNCEILMVMPRWRSSGRCRSDRTRRTTSRGISLRQHLGDRRGERVLPWSTCPIVPMLRWGFVRSNLLGHLGKTLLYIPAALAGLRGGQLIGCKPLVDLVCRTSAYSPRTRATISWETDAGTSWYELNCMVYVARPECATAGR